MVVSKSKVRVMISIAKTIDEKIEKIADGENRSKSNLIETILKKYLEDLDKQN